MKYLSVSIAACLCLLPAVYASTVTHALWDRDAAGAPIEVYTLTSAKAEVKIVTYGARLISLRVPNRDGVMGSVILGHDKLQDYKSPMNTWMGATIGRYANRIDRGQFTLEGKTYQIPLNQPTFALHGGPDSFHTKIWSAKVIRDGVEFSLVSPDGDMGFPGTLHVTVRYTLTQIHGDPALKMQFAATTDKHTILNMTNHAYFNLADDSSKPVFDHTFVLRAPGLKAPAAEVDDLSSGRTLQVYTTEPGAHLYAPRFSGFPPRAAGAPGAPGTPTSAGAPVPPSTMGAPPATAGAPPPRRPMIAAFCIETQHYPDSPHHPNFPSTELRPGQHYQTTTIYVFGVKH